MKTARGFAAWVGIDWADAEHAVCLISFEGSLVEHRTVAQRVEDLDAWAMELRRRFDGRPVAVCLEQSRGALVYALMKYDFLTLFPINPKQLARYRQALTPSGAKDDPTDAELLARFVREHHPQLRAWRPDDVLTRTLRLLSEDRRRWVDDRTAQTNRLQQRLKEYFPLALEFMKTQAYAVYFLKLLAKFPTHKELHRISPQQIERWFPKGLDGRSPRELLEWIRKTPPLVTDEAVVLAGRLAVSNLVEPIQRLNQVIAEYDRRLESLVATHPDHAIVRSLPGAGKALQPRLLAALGTDRTRIESAQSLQEYSGVAPVLIRSGKRSTVRRRYACPMFVRQSFHEFARCSIFASRWANAYYQMLRARGVGRHAAIRALAFKWIRIIYRCWKDRTLYSEACYLAQLEHKGSKILAFLAPLEPLEPQAQPS